MKIYIAGAITGHSNYRQHFMAAEWRLAEMGFSVMNPAWLCAYPAFAREDYLAVSRAMLERCEGVLLLPNWGGSAGVKAELRLAERRGMPVFDCETGEPGCWADLRSIEAKERQEREARLGVDFKEWIRLQCEKLLAEINAPGRKNSDRRELKAALDALSLAYDELSRREKE